MEIKVFCPGCRAVLRVPLDAAGKIARCPNCQCKFIVPDQNDVMEETVSSWIEQDVEDMQDEFEKQMRARAAEEARRKQEIEREKAAKTAEKIEKFFRTEPSGVTTAPPPPQAPTVQRPMAPGSPRMAPAGAAVGAASTVAPPAALRPETPVQSRTATPPQTSVTPNATPSPAAPVEAPPPSAPAPAPPVETLDDLIAAESPKEVTEYPANVFVDAALPHLVVAGCSQKGVLLAFDSSFLSHIGFRLSMPIACAFSSDDNRTNLIARPLAFFDISGGEVRNALEVESGHERRMSETDRPEQIVALFGLLPRLPKPFNIPMPYYVSTQHTNMSLECSTARREDGGITCYVLIPDGPYGLRWLHNVNGVCGPEFKLLAADVNRLWSTAWRGVSESVRQRLGTWVGFEPGERFCHYFNDAEFGKKDEGLAGIVLTDRRLIYHKYHRKGSIAYADQPQLYMRPDGDFAGLALRTAEGLVKIARFRISDVEPLVQTMAEMGLHVDLKKE